MVYEMVTTRLKLRLFVTGLILGLSPVVFFFGYKIFHSGIFLSKARLETSSVSQKQVAEAPTSSLPAVETRDDLRWKLIQENYQKLYMKNEQLNSALIYQPTCQVGVTRAPTNGRFTTEQLLRIYTDLYTSYKLRYEILQSSPRCRQALAMLKNGEVRGVTASVAF